MSMPCRFFALGFAALAACDDAPGRVGGSNAAPPIITAEAVTASATPPPPKTDAPMPPRPVPLGSSGPIQPNAPAERQMMTIAYTIAMVTPRGNDPAIVDRSFLD